MKENEIQKILKAGKIASQVREYFKTIIKKDMLLLETAEKVENKIIELGGKPAFPVNLSINDIAAHYTPFYNDETKAHGLLKIDLGVQIDGFIADTAFSIDLENSDENKKLIKAGENALNNAIKLIKEKIDNDNKLINKNKDANNELVNKKEVINKGMAGEDGKVLGCGVKLSEIGATIQQTIEKHGFSPIVNLSGHSMGKYDLHSGITIPNTNDNKNIKLKEGLYAIEPFSTSGNGKIQDGNLSGIYIINKVKNVRSQSARKILDFIQKEYQTLPFCSRWIIKKFGAKSLFALRELENNEVIKQFEQLVEVSHAKVSQAEHTVLIDRDKVIVTTM